MLSRFAAQFGTELPELKGKKVLLACSGGLDSVVLLHLMQQFEAELAIAHYNYKLRGSESEADAEFTKQLAVNAGLVFHLQESDTKQMLNDTTDSLQMLARRLRYDWFDALMQEHAYDFIMTAHQADDALETLLINLGRGSGLKGLSGIPQQNGKILRPLLKFTREELSAYAVANDLKWREDSSNASDAYLRNALRHKVIPQLKELMPDIVLKTNETQGYLKRSSALIKGYLESLRPEVWDYTEDGMTIHIQAIPQEQLSEILYQLLHSYGFTDWRSVYQLPFAETGRYLLSDQYRLTKNRDHLEVAKLLENTEAVFKISSVEDTDGLPISLTIAPVSKVEVPDAQTIVVDADLLAFPLSLRSWQPGDRFVPFGMKGSKKLSDYFTDLKLSQKQKQKIWLLCSGADIVWVVGHRADDRFKVSQTTKKLYKITCAD